MVHFVIFYSAGVDRRKDAAVEQRKGRKHRSSGHGLSAVRRHFVPKQVREGEHRFKMRHAHAERRERCEGSKRRDERFEEQVGGSKVKVGDEGAIVVLVVPLVQRFVQHFRVQGSMNEVERYIVHAAHVCKL